MNILKLVLLFLNLDESILLISDNLAKLKNIQDLLKRCYLKTPCVKFNYRYS